MTSGSRESRAKSREPDCGLARSLLAVSSSLIRNPKSAIRNRAWRSARIRARDAPLRHFDGLRMDVDRNDPLDRDVLAAALRIFTCLGFRPGTICACWPLSFMLTCCSCCSTRCCVMRVVADAAERVGRRVEAGVEGLDDLLHLRNGDHAAVRQLLRHLGERADRHDALGAVVKFVRLPAVRPQLLGQQMGVLGRFDERIVIVLLVAGPRTTSLAGSSWRWFAESSCRGTWRPESSAGPGNRAGCARRPRSSWRRTRRRPWAQSIRAAAADCA